MLKYYYFLSIILFFYSYKTFHYNYSNIRVSAFWALGPSNSAFFVAAVGFATCYNGPPYYILANITN